MAQSNDRPLGEHLQIAVFALGSFDRREEVRNGGFFRFIEVLRQSHYSTKNIFRDKRFAAKSKSDLE